MTTPKPALEHLPSLTPLRGIAALWVMLYHYSFQYFPNLHPEHYTQAVEKGYLAVDLFFMLSGFVLTHVYHAPLARDPTGGYWSFLRARIARVYPMHLVVLLLFLATALAARAMDYAATGSFAPIPAEGPRSFGAFVANLLMLQGLDASRLSWNYPSWSVSLEFLAYLGFPLVLPWVWRASGRGKLAWGALAWAALAALAITRHDDLNQWDGMPSLWRCMPEFLIGTLLYSAYRHDALTRRLRPDGVAIGLAVAIVLLLHFGGPDLLIVGVFALFILAAVANTGRIAATLNTRPLVWLGEVSYSLYLLHGLVQYVTTRLLVDGLGITDRAAIPGSASLSLMVAMSTASLLLAGPAYAGIEVGGRRYLRHVLGRQRRKTGSASP